MTPRIFFVDYSTRSAAIGSSRAARRAGMYPAASATPAINAATAKIVTPSVGFTSNSKLVIIRPNHREIARPSANPVIADGAA
jgi:hypothetical protein